MDLLPRTHHEFGNKDYWEKFFKKRGKKAFEWYGEYTQLCGILSKYIKTADKVLVIGCGNSQLSADMFDVGYRDIVNVDISSTVIQQMSEKHSESRPEMKFLCMDLMEMSFPDDNFSVVLDKGTLDAIFTDETPEVFLKVDRMLREIGRILRFGGRYICVSLAQDHIVTRILSHFANEGWMVRICRMPDADDAADCGKEFRLPVFVFVFTKFRKMPNSKSILEVSLFEDRIERLETVEKLVSSVQEVQRYALIRQRLQKSSGLVEQISLDLYGSSSALPRYTIYVVDGRGSPRKKFAVFIVPQGRETEWLFSCDEGRRALQENAGYERLLVVLLSRELEFTLLDEVKAELSTKVLELAPLDVQKQTPFLSLGDSINLRTIRDRGRSELSGEYVVEDVDRDGEVFRRLVFIGNRNMVQSEVRLMRDTKKKGGKKSQPLSIDHDYLSSSYYMTVVNGLAFVENLQDVLDAGLEILLLGLGGGPLSMYLRKNIPRVKVEAVEIDDAVVAVATKWFNLKTDDQLVVHVADGLQFVSELSQTELQIPKILKDTVHEAKAHKTMNRWRAKAAKFDLNRQSDAFVPDFSGNTKHVIILDVDNKDVSIGMSSPPEPFVHPEFLNKVHAALKPSGLLILNMLCRSQQKRDEVIGTLKEVFSPVFGIKHHDDLNETLFCLPKSRASDTPFVLNGKRTEELASVLKLLEDRINVQSKRPFSNKLDDLKQM